MNGCHRIILIRAQWYIQFQLARPLHHYCICCRTDCRNAFRSGSEGNLNDNPTSMGSSNMPAPDHNDLAPSSIPAGHAQQGLVRLIKIARGAYNSGSIRPHFFLTDGSHATASVHTEREGNSEPGNLHPHTASISQFSTTSATGQACSQRFKHFLSNPIQSSSTIPFR